MIAAQDQSLPTRWYQHNTLKKPDVNPKCRLSGRFDETIDHLVSGCPELAKTEYIHRHNKAAAHMHWRICEEFGTKVKDGMSMNPRLSPRMTASLLCGTCRPH